MTLSEFYKNIDGDYEDVMARFRGEERVLKFLKLFLKDSSASDLNTHMESGNYREAFRAAHTLKGVAANLSMTSLGNTASKMTEALRDDKDIELAKTLLPGFNEIYELTVSSLNALIEE